MARHLGDVSWRELQGLYAAVIGWLKRADVAGSIASDYSLYRAMEEEWDKATEARHERTRQRRLDQ